MRPFFSQLVLRMQRPIFVLFDGRDAALVRHALRLVHCSVAHLDKPDLDFIENICMHFHANGSWLWFRSLFTGTAPGLNTQLAKLPIGLKEPVELLFNDFFRSFGNMYWCCNPWTGLSNTT